MFSACYENASSCVELDRGPLEERAFESLVSEPVISPTLDSKLIKTVQQ